MLVLLLACNVSAFHSHSNLALGKTTSPPKQNAFINSRTPALSLSLQDFIEAGVSLDAFAPQFLWLPMIVAPEADITKKLTGSLVPILALALVHLTVALTAAAQDGALDQILIFAEVFDPSLSQLAGMQKLFAYPNFVAEEWPHVLIWDLFVGRAIWIDGIQRGINTRVALAFCNFVGPPGLLIHVATCLWSGKGLPSMGCDNALEDKEQSTNSTRVF